MPLVIEFAKMRRLRVWLVAGLLSGGTLLFAGMQLFSADYVAGMNRPGSAHWEGFLLFYGMIKAMTAPILAAVLASRQVEIEHQGNGWTSAALLGLGRGRLCAAKIVALAPVVAATTLFELGGLVVGSRLLGATQPLPVDSWGWYAAASFGITMALVGLHVWLSARFEQQLVGLGIGVLGAFVGVFAMLMPVWLARLLPWGYYALALPYAMVAEGGVARVPVEWPSLGLFVLIVPVLLAVALRSLNHES